MDIAYQLLKKAYDMHVHSSPDLFRRKMDDFQLAEWLAAAGMAGAVIKGHYGDTSSRVKLINDQRGDQPVHLFGSIVLNKYVGGLNPFAVEAAISLGAKVIWLPTIHAANHLRFYGGANYSAMKAEGASLPVKTGLTITDSTGAVWPDMLSILELVRDHDICLATGHIGNDEARLLAQAAKDLKVGKLILTHPDFETQRLPLEQQKTLAADGWLIEKTYLPLTAAWRCSSIDEQAQSIQAIGAQSCILTSDFGQPDNDTPPAGLAAFISGLLDQGISPGQIRTMVRDNPAKLLF